MNWVTVIFGISEHQSYGHAMSPTTAENVSISEFLSMSNEACSIYGNWICNIGEKFQPGKFSSWQAKKCWQAKLIFLNWILLVSSLLKITDSNRNGGGKRELGGCCRFFCRQISIKTKNWVASASSLRALKAQASLALHDSLHKVGKKSAFQCVACCCEKWKLAIKMESSIGWCCKCKNQHISWHQERKANFTGGIVTMQRQNVGCLFAGIRASGSLLKES